MFGQTSDNKINDGNISSCKRGVICNNSLSIGRDGGSVVLMEKLQKIFCSDCRTDIFKIDNNNIANTSSEEMKHHQHSNSCFSNNITPVIVDDVEHCERLSNNVNTIKNIWEYVLEKKFPLKLNDKNENFKENPISEHKLFTLRLLQIENPKSKERIHEQCSIRNKKSECQRFSNEIIPHRLIHVNETQNTVVLNSVSDVDNDLQIIDCEINDVTNTPLLQHSNHVATEFSFTNQL